ncbi:hypothetical protein METHB2_10041 [Candidatus Methylobacter favarea]|uniref:Uncharacterized protein n=1 Tax=Candidatus Methylobacter favarea TaxID=2707345 RepID=A0A8S0XGT5_9GAMM|nr:hypothetical protein METHB2_10041 [Candidatus Methylobacter favarea]
MYDFEPTLFYIIPIMIFINLNVLKSLQSRKYINNNSSDKENNYETTTPLPDLSF